MLLGCELSAEHDANPVHVLAYGFDPGEPVFAAKRAWIFEGRVARTRRMVERLRELGAPVELRPGQGAGRRRRPRAAARGQGHGRGGVVDTLGDAFSQDWIGTGGRAYVAKDAVTPTEAVELIHGAGGVAVLAHPSVHAGAAPVPEPVIRAMAAAGLDGLEVDHPDQPPATGPAGGPWPPSWAWRRPGPRTATAPSTATVWAASAPPTRPSTACSPGA